jgi:thioredoxin reductase (NADPH)
LEGFPSLAPVPALDLALRISEENEGHGVEIVPEDVLTIARDGATFRIATADGERMAKAVVIATGARLRMLDVPGAGRLMDRGVAQCAWCNASLVKGMDVAVVGGGDAAFQEALHLADYADRVTILVRGEAPRARHAFVAKAGAHERMTIETRTQVDDILGEDTVEGIRLRQGGHVSERPLASVFVYIGLSPASEAAADILARDDAGHIVTDARLATSVPGIFAAGAVRAGYGGRLTNAMGEATTAGMAAAAYAAEH